MSRRAFAWFSWLVAILIALALGAWAGRVTFSPPSLPSEGQEPTLYTVATQTVGRSISFPVGASWPRSPLATGATSGTVTSVEVASGESVSPGDVLYTVNLRPVVIARGSVPAFRDLTQGARGADVRQLQTFLLETGFASAKPDGNFGAATSAAVRRWQKSLGVPADGTVFAGDLLFAPELPTRMVLSDEVTPGAVLSPGVTVVHALASAPKFTVSLAAEQAGLVPTSGAGVVDAGPAGNWEATIASARVDNESRLRLELTSLNGGPVCGNQCDRVPIVEAEAVFSFQLVVVPDATGPAVPLSAIGTDAAGETFVSSPDGTSRPVSVVASGDGRAVVDGLSVGEEVRLVPVLASEDSGT